MRPEDYNSENARVCRERIAAASPFMRAAVRAYHRAERDHWAKIAEALDVCKATEWRGASRHVNRRQTDTARQLWHWGLKRWGMRAWPDLEYAIRELE